MPLAGLNILPIRPTKGLGLRREVLLFCLWARSFRHAPSSGAGAQALRLLLEPRRWTIDPVKTRRGRVIAVASVLLGLTVLAAAGFAFRDRIATEWGRWSALKVRGKVHFIGT